MTAEQAMNTLAGKHPNEVLIEEDQHHGQNHSWELLSGSERYEYAPSWWGLKKTFWNPRLRCCGKRMVRAAWVRDKVCQLCHMKNFGTYLFSPIALCQKCGRGVSKDQVRSLFV